MTIRPQIDMRDVEDGEALRKGATDRCCSLEPGAFVQRGGSPVIDVRLALPRLTKILGLKGGGSPGPPSKRPPCIGTVVQRRC
eukprot:scaffold11435_cov30-Tisochrysis_lutea.AAC.2